MARQARQQAASEIYHVMLRGVNRDAIFLEDADYERFVQTLALVKAASGCAVLAYCLMVNHVHLVIRAADEPIGTVMKRLSVRYVGWFNHKYGRVGHLFQGRFASIPVERDSYLISLIRYVWNNPVMAGLVAGSEQYAWSSRRWLGLHPSVVDEGELRDLLPDGGLEELAAMPPPSQNDIDDVELIASAPTEAQTVRLLRRACGAGGPSEFGRLDRDTQRCAVRELRMRSVPYARIAKAIGMSISTVRRLQVAGG